MTDPLSALGSDVFLVVAAHLALSELAQVLCVRKAWRTLLDGTPHLWRGLCKHVWASKAHVPAALSVLAEGEFAEMAEDEERRTLMHLRARELKDLVMSLRLERESRFLIEKGDFADAILSARRKAAEASSVTFTILNRPLQLVRREAGESLPKAALRLSLLDAQRLHITKEELMSFTFNVRVRHDGPLMQAMEFDPWWQGKGRGEATFEPDGLVAFKYATRPAARYASRHGVHCTWRTQVCRRRRPCRNARQRNATRAPTGARTDAVAAWQRCVVVRRFRCGRWPPDPDGTTDGAPMDPFAALGMRVRLGWRLVSGQEQSPGMPATATGDGGGCVVQLLFNGQPGPEEIVCRHPTTWGWVLYSGGSVWTSWEMPVRVRDSECLHAGKSTVWACSDPLLREEALMGLPSACGWTY
jgi:hypothetical protein